MQAEKKLKWCLKQGEKGEKHRGIRKIEPDNEEAENQIKKALSDLETMRCLYRNNKTDWVASAGFYAMYHALLAILYKLGYESRNQECTINAIEYFIKKGVLRIEWLYISMIRGLKENEDDAKKLRENMQYSSRTRLEEERCKTLMENAKKFVEKMRAVLNEIK